MLELLRKRREDEDRGFTLIELMVVVLIIAILIAIAIPTFLGARKRAQDRASQSNLRNALTAEKTYYTDAQAYTSDGNTTSGLGSIEPSLKFDSNTTTPGAVGKVALALPSGITSVVCLQAESASGKFFQMMDVSVDSTGYTAGTYYGSSDTAVATCDASFATGDKW
jgi:type IV pilus assembly protein PilA